MTHVYSPKPHFNSLPDELFLNIVDFVVLLCQRDISSGEFRPACQSILNLRLVDRRANALTMSAHGNLIRNRLPASQMRLFRSIASASRNSHALGLAQLTSSVGRLWKNENFVNEKQAISNILSALVREDACRWFQICFTGIMDMALGYATTRVFDLHCQRIKDSDTLPNSPFVLAVATTDDRYPESRLSLSTDIAPVCVRVEVWHDLRFIGDELTLRGHWRELNGTHTSFRKSWIWVCRKYYPADSGPDLDCECLFFYDPETTITWNGAGEVLAREARHMNGPFVTEGINWAVIRDYEAIGNTLRLQSL